jgi:starch phosphorylase
MEKTARTGQAAPREHTRTGMSAEIFTRAIRDNLYFVLGRHPELATNTEWFRAAAYTLRDRLMERWIRGVPSLISPGVRVASYLSAEFLIGPQLGHNLLCLGVTGPFRQALANLGQSLDELEAVEEEPGLGNGGLGRLAACYLESLSTLEMPAFGYGIRYEFGIFDQAIRDCAQVEVADKWLRFGNPWEIPRYEISFPVPFGGRTEHCRDEQGRYRVRWIPDSVIKGMAYDTPIPGYGVDMVNILRLWKSESFQVFDFQAFNRGDYYGAVDQEVKSENLTKVLYPNDEKLEGKELRLRQQYFFVSCSLRDMIRLHRLKSPSLDTFADKFAIQLNDTHPSVAVAELMRLLVDEHGLDWEKAWSITKRCISYTNHTLLPEALEKWPVALFSRLLPRPFEILLEINRRFLEDVRARYPGDDARAARLSIIDESGERYVRMAHLAAVGSGAINGVAELHSKLLREEVLHEFHELWPEKFMNVTNGVAPRRWMGLVNPGLAALLDRRIGPGWLRDTEAGLRRLEEQVDDPVLAEEWRAVKRRNKEALARLVRERTGVEVDPSGLFDIQVKRIHEYKRQHLNLLFVASEIARLRADPRAPLVPRTVILGGKAAPGYFLAKLIIRLAHGLADLANRDRDVDGRLKLVFYPDFNVKNSQPVYPAADLSEQISTAGKEASGTGNMKFALNGALTIGTLDGANIEIREAVGAENFFLFGMTAREVARRRAEGYRPWERYQEEPALRAAIELIGSGECSGGDRALYRPLLDGLLGHDPFFVLADFADYVRAQREVDALWSRPDRWTRASILNTARSGRFSSDRSVREYAASIWGVKPVPVPAVDPRDA